LAGGLPPSSRTFAVPDVAPLPAEAFVWLIDMALRMFKAYASADEAGAGIMTVWVLAAWTVDAWVTEEPCVDEVLTPLDRFTLWRATVPLNLVVPPRTVDAARLTEPLLLTLLAF
ncbi:MAG TPA: hypothetical protein VMO88_17835, partial [Acidimicrobiales bacterium]|nr:hypothetical protein [Acidimicrobiales bacterium]